MSSYKDLTKIFKIYINTVYLYYNKNLKIMYATCHLQIDRRIRDYEVKIINDPREGKRLLVLDIDYTLFDHRSSAETGYELMRPYLHEFLTSAYEVCNILKQ